jgi:hypothetical protein
LSEEHQFDSTHRIEIARAIDEVPDTRCQSTAEERLKTPLSLVNVICGRDNVLKLMLYVVNIFDNRFVFVIETDDNDDVAFDILVVNGLDALRDDPTPVRCPATKPALLGNVDESIHPSMISTSA